MISWEKIALLLLGGIVGFLVNVFLIRVKNKDEFRKERLKNLYYPLNAIIEKKYKRVRLMKHHFSQDFEIFAVAYYNFFLELRDTYLDNKIYESLKLRHAFHSLLDNYEVESLTYYGRNSDKNIAFKALALFELKHKVDEDELSEMERNLERVIDVIQEDILKMGSIL